jgi:hypothetical protein
VMLTNMNSVKDEIVFEFHIFFLLSTENASKFKLVTCELVARVAEL